MSASIAQKIVDLEVLIQEEKTFIKSSKLEPTDPKELQQSKHLIDESIKELWLLYSSLFNEVVKEDRTFRKAIREDRNTNLIDQFVYESVVNKLSRRVALITKDSKKFER